MFNGPERMEKRQMKQYGDKEEYKAYADSTPIILPFIPIYHLNKTGNNSEKNTPESSSALFFSGRKMEVFLISRKKLNLRQAGPYFKLVQENK